MTISSRFGWISLSEFSLSHDRFHYIPLFGLEDEFYFMIWNSCRKVEHMKFTWSGMDLIWWLKHITITLRTRDRIPLPTLWRESKAVARRGFRDEPRSFNLDWWIGYWRIKGNQLKTRLPDYKDGCHNDCFSFHSNFSSTLLEIHQMK